MLFRSDDSSAALHAIVRIGTQTQGGAGSTGPNGGEGLGGGLSAENGSTATLQNVPIMANWADGAPGDSRGGPAGRGLGGGVYVASNVTVIANTQTLIAGNHASKDSDDVWGTITVGP